MTSKPASRRARATIFAPRSCPSSPGLATSTRILREVTSPTGSYLRSAWRRSPVFAMASRSPATGVQSKPLPSFAQRGIRCRWKCGTDWKAAAPLACSRLRPSGLTASRIARATRLAVAIAALRSSTSASNRVGAWRFVTTRQWPGFSGLMSMKVSVRSSSSIFVEGIRPSRILQNTQSLIVSDLHGPAVGIRRLAVLDPHDGVVEALGELSDLRAVDDHALALVGELPDGRDDGGGAGAPDLLQGAPLVGVDHVVDGDLSLADAHS